MEKDFFIYEVARAKIAQLKSPPKNCAEYRQLFKDKQLIAATNETPGFPSDPAWHYKKNNSWQGWKHFLNTSAQFVDYEEACGLLQQMQNPPKTMKVYKDLSKTGLLPQGLPFNPDVVYKDNGWSNCYAYLGKNNRSYTKRGDFLSYEQAVTALRNMDNPPTNRNQYQSMFSLGDLPVGFPSAPHTKYVDSGWVGYGEFFGTGRTRIHPNNILDFDSAVKAIRSMPNPPINFKEYKMFYKQGLLPKGMPSVPSKIYENAGWNGMGEFLGIV